ncbi:hypothetical protein CH330_00940, partial [candidate division WOR-3 bacterium JGI_Cruoil_03_51_56]
MGVLTWTLGKGGPALEAHAESLGLATLADDRQFTMRRITRCDPKVSYSELAFLRLSVTELRKVWPGRELPFRSRFTRSSWFLLVGNETEYGYYESSDGVTRYATLAAGAGEVWGLPVIFSARLHEEPPAARADGIPVGRPRFV